MADLIPVFLHRASGSSSTSVGTVPKAKLHRCSRYAQSLSRLPRSRNNQDFHLKSAANLDAARTILDWMNEQPGHQTPTPLPPSAAFEENIRVLEAGKAYGMTRPPLARVREARVQHICALPLTCEQFRAVCEIVGLTDRDLVAMARERTLFLNASSETGVPEWENIVQYCRDIGKPLVRQEKKE